MVIDIANAQPGMKLLEDVLLPNGSILINASQILSQTTIGVMAKRGIRKIQIVAEAEETKPVEKEKPEETPSSPQDELAAIVEQFTPPSPPKLRVVVKDDKMSVKLCVEPTDAQNQILERDHIIAVLSENNIVFGINEQAISGIIEKWLKYKRYYEVEDIAKGTMPQPGKEGPYEFKVKHLTTQAAVDAVRKIKYYSDIPRDLFADRVDADTVIAVRGIDVPPFPGTDVYGNIVTTEETIKTEMKGDNSVSFADDNQKIIAKSTGFAYVINSNTVGVVLFQFDGSIEIAIPQDRMKAEITVHAPGPLGKVPTRDDVRSLLFDNKIVFGVKDAVIDALCKDLVKNRYPGGPVLIAEGVPAVHGENGKVKFLFNTLSSLKPKVNKDGSADFKNIDLVNSVTKGQKLAELEPPTNGTPGKTILGSELPCLNGEKAKLPIGQNTVLSQEDASVLCAGTDGNVRYNGSTVDISEGFVIKGNVDFSTGNIKYPKSVEVAGDIKSGFRIECGGDLQVAGTIEDADIQVNGNVLCKLGFVGQGKGLINAKGDVNIGFLKNQTVKSRQNIAIAKEALNCTLFARKAIEIHGNPLSLAGGKVLARDSVTAHTIGNMSGIKTIVEVGTDFTLIEELEKTDVQIAELEENRKKILVTYQRYEKIKELKKSLSAKDEFLFEKLKTTLSKYDMQIKTLDDRKAIIAGKMNNFKTSFIKIEHSAMPGTMFKIGPRHFLVKEEIIGPKSVRLINEEIRVV